MGSPTALADDAVLQELLQETKGPQGRCIYVATGALWGALDIQKMADIGTLKVFGTQCAVVSFQLIGQGLKVTMKKHPSNFKVLGRLVPLVESVRDVPITLYEGI